MIAAQVLVAIGTGISALAGTEIVKSLFRGIMRPRVSKDERDKAKKIEIAQIAANSGDVESTVPRLISALEGTRKAVVIAGDLAVVKDSARGDPHIVVKHLSSGQREKIRNHEAPINDASAFETWLG